MENSIFVQCKFGFLTWCDHSKAPYIKYLGGGRGQRILQIFQKNFRSPGNYRPKYLKAQ